MSYLSHHSKKIQKGNLLVSLINKELLYRALSFLPCLSTHTIPLKGAGLCLYKSKFVPPTVSAWITWPEDGVWETGLFPGVEALEGTI